MTDLLLNVQNNLQKLIEHYIDNHKLSAENSYSMKTHSAVEPSHIIYSLNTQEMDTYLDVATELQKPLLDDRMFYMHDISTNQQSPYNTLLFHIDGHCYKSKETTSQIIKRFGDYNNLQYQSLQMIGQMVGVPQRCPYVLGNYYFSPDRGTSKNEANWLALHHVLHYESNGEKTHFVFREQHELVLPLNKNMVEQMVERAYILSTVEQIILINWLKNYEKSKKAYFFRNVVQKRALYLSMGQKVLSTIDIFNQLSLTKAVEMTSKLLGENYVSLDEIKEFYPGWFGKK